MITDAVIRLITAIIGFLIDLLPSAPIITTGNGVASGYPCCIAYLTNRIGATMATTTIIGGTSVAVIQNIGNTPLAVLIDWQLVYFMAGCAISILLAFVLLKTLIMFWTLAKPF